MYLDAVGISEKNRLKGEERCGQRGKVKLGLGVTGCGRGGGFEEGRVVRADGRDGGAGICRQAKFTAARMCHLEKIAINSCCSRGGSSCAAQQEARG